MIDSPARGRYPPTPTLQVCEMMHFHAHHFARQTDGGCPSHPTIRARHADRSREKET